MPNALKAAYRTEKAQYIDHQRIAYDAKELLMRFQAEYRDITFDDFEKHLFKYLGFGILDKANEDALGDL